MGDRFRTSAKNRSTLRILASATNYRPGLGGVATCAYELCRALSARGDVELRLIAPSCEGADAFDAHGYFETKRISLPRSETRAVLPLARYTASEIQEFKPDAVFDFLWLPSSVSSRVLKLRPGFGAIPYFTLVHGVEVLDNAIKAGKLGKVVLRLARDTALRNAQLLFSVSRFTADQLHSHCGVPREKVRVCFNGVDPEYFSPRPKAQDLIELWGLKGKTVFLTISRLDDYKGMDQAILSLKHVLKENRDFVYLICGEGGDRPRLERLIHEHDFREHVRLVGSVEPDRLRDYYNLADCFVLLSRDDWETPNFEGFGLVFLEAAACGVPSIAGNSGGIPDAVVDGQTGWLVPPTDEKAIAHAWLDCIRDPQKRKILGQNAMERARAQMSWSHMAERVVSGISENL